MRFHVVCHIFLSRTHNGFVIQMCRVTEKKRKSERDWMQHSMVDSLTAFCKLLITALRRTRENELWKTRFYAVCHPVIRAVAAAVNCRRFYFSIVQMWTFLSELRYFLFGMYSIQNVMRFERRENFNIAEANRKRGKGRTLWNKNWNTYQTSTQHTLSIGPLHYITQKKKLNKPIS